MGKQDCHAPVFDASNLLGCIILTIIYTLVIIELTILFIIAILGGPDAIRKVACMIKQYVYRITYCTRGNSDPNILI